MRTYFLKKSIDYQLPNQPKTKSILYILFLFIYIPSQKLATNYLELFMATKTPVVFVCGRNLYFSWAFGGSSYQPNQRLHPKNFPPLKAQCCVARRRAVQAHGRKSVVRGLQGHHVRQLGRPRMTVFQGWPWFTWDPWDPWWSICIWLIYNIPHQPSFPWNTSILGTWNSWKNHQFTWMF